MRALYKDIELDDAQVEIVQDYLWAVDFHLPGATPDDFDINRTARYLGYMFQKEDLESFGVGLKATHPDHLGHNTFIRMSRDQLLGVENPKMLPLNPPVMASEMMTMQRFWEAPTGPATHGVDAYTGEEGIPGGRIDLAMLEETLGDILNFSDDLPVHLNQEILDLKVNWGTLLAGRYPRLKHFESKGRLSAEQQERLIRLENAITEHTLVLEKHGLPTLETLKTKPVVNG